MQKMIRILSLFWCLTMSNAFRTAYVGSSISGFSGTICVTGAVNGGSMNMKKGKPNVPPQMRGQYARQQEMQAMKEQYLASQKPGPDGLPIFNLFVRTSRANMWYPCGTFKGDESSKALCKTYSDGGFFSGISKKQLDAGVAGSLFRDIDRLVESVVSAYPQLKKKKGELIFGYKLAFEGLDDQSIVEVEPAESKGFVDNIKNILNSPSGSEQDQSGNPLDNMKELFKSLKENAT